MKRFQKVFNRKFTIRFVFIKLEFYSPFCQLGHIRDYQICIVCKALNVTPDISHRVQNTIYVVCTE